MPFGLDWMDMLMGGAGIATGAGAIAQGIGQAGAYEDQQKAARRLRGVAQQPLDPMQFYRPMSEAERVAFQRSIKADLASRGIPFDSSYATALTSELMAKTEGERWNAAVQQAISGRQTVQSGLVGGMPPPYPNANYAGAMSGALGYFGNKYGQPRQAPPQAGYGGGGYGAARYNEPGPPGIIADPSTMGSMVGGYMGSGGRDVFSGGTPRLELGEMSTPPGWQNFYEGVPFPSQMGPAAYADWSSGLPQANFGGLGGAPY